MTSFVVAHGAWSAGWAWKKMHPLLRAAGHELLTPSYTGLGERRHLADPAIDLECHVQDVLGVLEVEDLTDVVLVGHSYGGMVATAVADRARDRIARLVYLDAFVPEDGNSLFDLLPAAARADTEALAKAEGKGWLIPPNPVPSDTAEADIAWILPRRHPQPIATFQSPLRLVGGALTLPRAYIYCLRPVPGDVFRRFADHARHATGWRCHEIDASHSPQITAPEILRDVLVRIVGDQG